ncbi:MAG TPA: hypothetical protein VHM02_09270, partial [Thermoanaerobaculia bacterium]|nr:hypothetical protein [Thermoanaerobaculia bacterium]
MEAERGRGKGGVDPDERLRSLIAAGDAAAVRRLLAEAPPGLDVDRRDARGRTALHDAAEAGDAAVVA